MSIVSEFKTFISRGNVIDMAVGVIIGGAFGKIVSSLTDDVIMPPIGAILGKVDFSKLFIPLAGDTTKFGLPMDQVKAEGIPVIAYGNFINQIISFLIIALCVFFLVKAVNRLMPKAPEEPAAPTTRECPECLSQIPIKAKRCMYCTAEVPPVKEEKKD
ncbi:MAG: large conductance mechanosensitive channel protein MscL [bacterium]|nr:large conductance mechanosensitive channel protein MscL [bacterium]